MELANIMEPCLPEHHGSEGGVLPPFKVSISVVFPDPPHIKEKLDTHFSVFVGEAVLQDVLLTCLISLLKKVMLNLPEDNMKTALEVVKRLQAMKVLASTGASADSVLLGAEAAKDQSHELFPKCMVSLVPGYQHRSEADLPMVSNVTRSWTLGQADDRKELDSRVTMSCDLGSFSRSRTDLEVEDEPVRIRRTDKTRSTAPAGIFRLREPSDQLKACVKDAVERARTSACLPNMSDSNSDPLQQNRASTGDAGRSRRNRGPLQASLFKTEPALASISEDSNLDVDGHAQDEDARGSSHTSTPNRSGSTRSDSDMFAVGEDSVAPRAPTRAGDIHSTPSKVPSRACPGRGSEEVAAYLKESR